jgi:hypothetical protein
MGYMPPKTVGELKHLILVKQPVPTLQKKQK